MCYCDQCKKKALDIGLNLDEKLSVIKKFINESLNSENVNYDNVLPQEKIIGDLVKLDLEKLLEFKRLTIEETFLNIREHLKYIDPKVNIEAIVNAEQYLNEGISFENPPSGVSGIDMISYYPELKTIISKVQLALNSLKNNINLFPCIRITYPMIQDNDQIKEIIESLSKYNINGINFYNYGWATE